MQGFSSGSTFLVNAEVDFMGGIVDSGVGIGTKPSPHQEAIEKAQAELRLEYDVREERRRELEFLEKGGDPLDFRFGHAASVSIQSTSHSNQHPDQNLTSEAKGSFALTASPHGDSVESSGRLGATNACEPNSADNFDCENEILQSDRKSMRPSRSNTTRSEHSSQLDRSCNVNDLEDSPIFHSKKGQSYRRRNRYRSNRDDPPSSSADMASRGGNGSSVPARLGILSKPVASEKQFEMESDGTHSMTSRVTKFAEGKLNLSNSKEKLKEVQNLSLKADEALVAIKTVEPAIVVGRDSLDNLDVDRHSSLGAENTKYNVTFAQLNETSKVNGDDKCTPTDALTNNAPGMTKGLDFESSCSQTNVSVDGNGNIGSDLCNNLKTVEGNGSLKEQTLPVGENSVSIDKKMLSEDHVTNAMRTASYIKEDQISIDHQGNGSTKQDHVDVAMSISNVEAQEKHEGVEIKSEKEPGQLDDCGPKMESFGSVGPPLVDPASDELNRNGISGQPPLLETLPGTENQSKPLDKAQEDRILEEAQMIMAKRKRIAALSIGLRPREHRQKHHWDFVLEEMAWLANDFAQERLWKMMAAAQICRHAAFASRIRLKEQSKFSNLKSVAHTLAKAVMEFWHSARLSVENDDRSQLEKCKHGASSETTEMDKASRDVLQSIRWKQDHAVYGYAVRFLQFNSSPKPLVEVEVPGFTDVACDIGLPELSWQDQFTEENLFYAVPPGAMEMYRKSIETCLAESKRISNNIREEVVTSAHDAAADKDYEVENLYYQPGALDAEKPPKKKLKILKSCKFEGEFGYGHCGETRNRTTQLNLMEKRPANNLHVDPIPMKRIRTASRQRVVSPFGAGPVGVGPVLSRADASSEDTNSFQDDQNTLHGGSVVPRGLEVDSTMNFEKQSTYDSAETSAKPKKKMKIKHQSLSYDQRWQLGSSMQNEQKDLVRKRSVNHQLEPNGNGSLFGEHAKKPKLAKHSLDNSFDNTAPLSGSVASPVASQMSNMSSQTKLIKLIGGRDRGKKGKGLKGSTGQLGSGSPWTIVEDQALVVLVHDMGPNWELVSDAINRILQFKCIFRKPRECKERHRFLMDRPGDGADSGGDSGSSQPYPSTLPGIPKGSARQLFRSLHAHVEEDNIKSRFEKIIHIEEQLYFRKKKNDKHDLKQIAPAHGSHVLSLSQVIPNNVNGGVLTPLDFSETATSNQVALSIGGLPVSNQSSMPLTHPPSGLSSSLQSLQGSPSMDIGNNLASPPSQLPSARDARYSVPGSGSLPIEEQQRLHQYNSRLPGRNVQATNLSSSGSVSGSDRGVRMHPGGNGVSMMPGLNKNISIARPGVQGIPSSANVLASNMAGMPSNINVHSGTASGRGNGKTMFRPRDSLHAMRSSEHQRQMVLPGMQMPTHTSSPGAPPPPFGGLSPGYPGHNDHPHVLNTPHSNLSTSNHGVTPEQQAYIHISRERQIQQRLLPRQHQHQQNPVSSSLMTYVQSPPQLPTSSPSSSPMTHLGPVPHQQQKNGQGLGRSAQSASSGMINQGGEQWQGQGQGQVQQYQQSGRQHPQPRQQAQPQQTPKLMKGTGRGNKVMHQNLPIEPSHLNGLNFANSASQVNSGSTLNTMPPSKPLVSPATSSLTQPQKQYVQQISSHIDDDNQGKALGSNQGPSSTVVLYRNRQQLQGQPSLKMVNQSQPALQRISQQNCQMNSDSLAKSKVDHSLTEQKSLSTGPPPACVDSSNNVFKKVRESSSMTSESSLLSPRTGQADTNALGIEPFSSVSNGLVVEKHSSCNNLVSHEFEAQWQLQESQLQPPSVQPILPQKQSQIQGGQSAVFTGTTSSRLD